MIRNDLTGKIFGRYTVIKYIRQTKHRFSIWLCKCECGNIKEVLGSNLTSGRTKSCGCLNREVAKRHSKEKSHLWKGGYSSLDIPLYDTYAHRIEYAEEVRRSKKDKNILEVKCAYCGKWYVPTISNVNNRIQSLNIINRGENNFYCSIKCKNLCPTYKKQSYQVGHPRNDERPYQQEWSKMVMERANFKCEICGSRKNLISHHELPVKTHPHLQADVDNGICLCENCHIIHGHKDECSADNLKNMVC